MAAPVAIPASRFAPVAAIDAVPSGMLCNVSAKVTTRTDPAVVGFRFSICFTKSLIAYTEPPPRASQRRESCQPRSMARAEGMISARLAAIIAIAALISAQPLNLELRLLPSPTNKKPIRVANAANEAMAKPRLNELEILDLNRDLEAWVGHRQNVK